MQLIGEATIFLLPSTDLLMFVKAGNILPSFVVVVFYFAGTPFNKYLAVGLKLALDNLT